MDCSLFPTGLYRVPTTLWLVDRCHRFKNGVPGLRQCLGGGVHDACRSGYLVPTGSITLLYGQCRSRSHPRKRQSHFGLVPEKRTAHCRWMGRGGVLYRCDVGPPIIVLAHVALGWQGAFLFSGALAMIWVLLWWRFYHSPDTHPNLSQEEFELIHQDNEPVLPRLPFLKSLAILSKNKKFYGIAIPAFLAEPAWAVFSFWVPLYLATERGMDLKQIAMFAWLPFLAADIGSVASGYLTKLYQKWFGCSRVNSVVASSVTGAFMMVSLAFVAVTKDPYLAIALISIGGFGHQVISCMLSALVVDSFDKNQVATVNGLRGSSAWIASFLFTLLIGAVSDTIGFNPLFIAMGFFDLIGAVFLIALFAERRNKPQPTV